MTLRWHELELEPGATYQLQQAGSSNFSDARLLLDGADHMSFVSGLSDGSYHFRVRVNPAGGAPGAWSAPYVLQVEHHSLAFSLALLGIGAAVFVLTVAFVSTGGFGQSRKADA